MQRTRLYYYNKDYTFVIVGKCASRTMKHILYKDLKWKETRTLTDVIDKHLLAIIRHPLDRWLSGISEYFKGMKEDNIDAFTREEYVRKLIQDSPLDGHTFHQNWYFRTNKQLTLFKFDELDKMWEWFADNGFKIPKKVHLNKLKDSSVKVLIYANLSKTIKKYPHLYDKLMKLYDEDLEYYEGVV